MKDEEKDIEELEPHVAGLWMLDAGFWLVSVIV